MTSMRQMKVEMMRRIQMKLIIPSPASLYPRIRQHYISSHGNARGNDDSETKCEKTETMEVEIISSENIKPAFPTPNNLRTYKLSVLDQIIYPSYVPLLLFYANSQKTNTCAERIESLKQSLSKTLVQFYPFAGKIIDNASVDCTDEGVRFIETRVNYSLSNELPNNQLISRLVPHVPFPCAIVVQVNIFSCGGVAICTSISHKLIDGHSYVVFIKAWAANTRGSSMVVYPSFIAPTLFPQNSSITHVNPPNLVEVVPSTRRLIFDSSAIIGLKTAISKHPTRVEIVSALLWKCATASFRAKYGSKRSSILAIVTNLRRKSSPPLPDNCIGNILWWAVAQYTPQVTHLDLCYVVDLIRTAVGGIKSDFIEEIKGENGYIKISECIEGWGKLLNDDGGVDFLTISSLCNSGIYEHADFGWGKPVLFYPYGAFVTNQILLADTESGDGIEAWVTLREEDMDKFIGNPELLQYASVDPKPIYLI